MSLNCTLVDPKGDPIKNPTVPRFDAYVRCLIKDNTAEGQSEQDATRSILKWLNSPMFKQGLEPLRREAGIVDYGLALLSTAPIRDQSNTVIGHERGVRFTKVV